jgi:hypothetical protein
MSKSWMKGFMVLMLAVALIFGGSTVAAAKSYSGSHAIGGSSISSHSGTYSGSYSGSRSGGTTYNSGYKSPSSNVTGSRYSGSGSYTTAPRSSGWGHFFGGFGAGMLFSGLFHSMFHPFGYYGYGGYHSFSIFGLLIDLLLLWIVYRIVRGLFFRR